MIGLPAGRPTPPSIATNPFTFEARTMAARRPSGPDCECMMTMQGPILSIAAMIAAVILSLSSASR